MLMIQPLAGPKTHLLCFVPIFSSYTCSGAPECPRPNENPNPKKYLSWGTRPLPIRLFWFWAPGVAIFQTKKKAVCANACTKEKFLGGRWPSLLCACHSSCSKTGCFSANFPPPTPTDMSMKESLGAVCLPHCRLCHEPVEVGSRSRVP